MPETEDLRLAVYGTLRVDQTLFEWIKPDVIRYYRNAITRGDLYHLRGPAKAYPLADLDGSGLIIVDVLYCRADRDAMAVIRMEVGAGYQLREVDVTLPDGSFTTAHAFHWPFLRGPKIVSGDWLTERRSRTLA